MFIKNTFLQNLTLDTMCVLSSLSSLCRVRHKNVNMNTIAEIKFNIPYNIYHNHNIQLCRFMYWFNLVYCVIWQEITLQQNISQVMVGSICLTQLHWNQYNIFQWLMLVAYTTIQCHLTHMYLCTNLAMYVSLMHIWIKWTQSIFVLNIY